MFDPLSASTSELPTKQVAQLQATPPATPSKSRLTSRPPPYRPQQQPQQQPYQQQQPRQHLQHPSQQLNGNGSGNGAHGPAGSGAASASTPGYTTTYRSQSPLAPRPPLPGQVQRPVSPIRWESTTDGMSAMSAASSAMAAGPSYSSGSPAQVYSPATPNAWATSPPSTSSPAFPHQQHQQQQQSRQQQYSNAASSGFAQSPPAPLGVPSPVTAGFGQTPHGTMGSTAPRIASPGLPRSPVAEGSGRASLSSAASAQQSQSQPQPQQHRAPPGIRIRVHGIDRSKKELGIKMDCSTNVPTYHRSHSGTFSRTYAEFSSLHAALSANHPETILPALPLPQTSATSEEEEDRFLKGIFQRFMDRITKDKALILDDELRGFVEADFGYTPLTRAKKLKAASGFLARSTSKASVLLDENGEPDFLQSSKVHSAALETALLETCKSLEKSLKTAAVAAGAYSDLSGVWTSFSTTEHYAPLAGGMRTVAEALGHVTSLENGQGNATALILGDALAYSSVEARSAKDALLQRQYSLDELHASIKTSINKRRAIEKLRASGSIKPEKVNEALDDLDEAVKHEQTLNTRVDAISNNLRPALQNHLRIMDEDLFSTLLHHARTMHAYEDRKLGVLQNLQERLSKVPERGAAQEGSIIYHQPQAASSSMSAGPSASSRDGSIALPRSASGAAPLAPPALSAASGPDPMSASTVSSRFAQTQAQMRAQMEASKAEEERQRRLHAERLATQRDRQQQQQQQQQQPQQASAPISQPAPTSPAPLPTSPQSPQRGLPQSQSMFLPGPRSPQSSASATYAVPAASARSPPASPARGQGQARQQPSAGASSAVGIDPLSGLPTSSAPTSTIFSGPPPPAPAQAQARSQQLQPHLGGQAVYQGQNHGQGQPAQNGMTQSAFLPGRNANIGSSGSGSGSGGSAAMRPGQQNGSRAAASADERKRSDARKAASLLAGAF